MFTFFHGWRRKAGLVTLVMACLFTAGWVKSLRLTDIVVFNSGAHSTELFYSFDSSIVWAHFQGEEPVGATIPEWDTVSKTEYSFFEDPEYDWHLRGAGFGIGRCARKNLAHIGIAPYWATAVPLAVVSAYLLLAPPQKRRSPIQADST